MKFVSALKSQLEAHANPEQARAMEGYMKDLFSFYGIQAPARKTVLKETIKNYKEELTRNSVIEIANILYQDLHRELHYCAIELIDQFLKKRYKINDIHFIKNIITINSWWDSVDFIACITVCF